MVPILHSSSICAAPSRMMRRSSQHPCNHDACYSNVTPAQLTFNIIRLSKCLNCQLLQREAISPHRGCHLGSLNGMKPNWDGNTANSNVCLHDVDRNCWWGVRAFRGYWGCRLDNNRGQIGRSNHGLLSECLPEVTMHSLGSLTLKIWLAA